MNIFTLRSKINPHARVLFKILVNNDSVFVNYANDFTYSGMTFAMQSGLVLSLDSKDTVITKETARQFWKELVECDYERSNE
jgi:hypothetical protein